MLLAEGAAGPDLLLTQRQSGMRAHSGQPAFPGGAFDDDDADAAACALREAAEEVGVVPGSVQVLASLPPIWVPVTGFEVTAVLGWWRRPGPVAAHEAEVAAVHRVPVAELADPANRVRCVILPAMSGRDSRSPGCWCGVYRRTNRSIAQNGGWERPWLPSRIVEIEPGAR